MSKDASARDIAVLISVADNTEPVFVAYQKNLPPLRALVHITRSGVYPHVVRTPGEALAVQDGMRTARRDYWQYRHRYIFSWQCLRVSPC